MVADGAPLATHSREHLLAILERWQSRELTAAEVEDWANLVEWREDPDPADPVVADAVFDLANPVLQGALEEVGPVLLRKLRG